MKRKLFALSSVLLSVFFVFAVAAPVLAESADTIEDAFKEGNFSGTIGNYFEYSNLDADDSDYGWSSTYFTLKYETASWNNLKFGARFFAHGETFNDNDDSVTDPFDADIETKTTLPELYLDYSFGEGSSVRVGRYDHQKVSHIDDNQSEGGYVIFKEIPQVELTAGVMTRFAEIDYDDGEDFGRTGDQQDLDSATYGDGASAYLIYLEGKGKLLEEKLCLNPYIMMQDDYAGVYGIDATVETELQDWELTIGSKAGYYYVDSSVENTSNSQNWSIFPYIKKGYFTLTAGYAGFDDDDSLNKPAWYRDTYTVLDQRVQYAAPGSKEVFGMIQFKKDKFWAHYAMGDNNYDFTATTGDRTIEHELQFGYNFTKSLDANLRLFDVQYDNVDDRDYQRVETSMRFQF